MGSENFHSYIYWSGIGLLSAVIKLYFQMICCLFALVLIKKAIYIIPIAL